MSRLLKVFPFLLTLVLIGCGYVPTTPDDVETLKKGVVKINNGAGFIVGLKEDGSFFIVTAEHVIKDTSELQIQFYDNRALSPIHVSVADATVVNRHQHDLTILRVKSNVKNYHIFTFSSSLPKSSDDVIVISFPNSSDGGWDIFPLKVSSADSEGMQILKSGSDASGFSGGPVIKDGKVVGMVGLQISSLLKVLPASIISPIADKAGAIVNTPPVGGSPEGTPPKEIKPPEETKPKPPSEHQAHQLSEPKIDTSPLSSCKGKRDRIEWEMCQCGEKAQEFKKVSQAILEEARQGSIAVQKRSLLQKKYTDMESCPGREQQFGWIMDLLKQ